MNPVLQGKIKRKERKVSERTEEQKQEDSIERRKEVKRRTGQQLASAGLKLTSFFYKGPEEERRVKGMLRPPQPSLSSFPRSSSHISPSKTG